FSNNYAEGAPAACLFHLRARSEHTWSPPITSRGRILFCLAWSPERAARFRTGMLTVFYDLGAVHENMLHADRILMRFFERRAIGDRCRVEYDHVGKHSFLEKSTAIQTEICGRHS